LCLADLSASNDLILAFIDSTDAVSIAMFNANNKTFEGGPAHRGSASGAIVDGLGHSPPVQTNSSGQYASYAPSSFASRSGTTPVAHMASNTHQPPAILQTVPRDSAQASLTAGGRQVNGDVAESQTQHRPLPTHEVWQVVLQQLGDLKLVVTMQSGSGHCHRLPLGPESGIASATPTAFEHIENIMATVSSQIRLTDTDECVLALVERNRILEKELSAMKTSGPKSRTSSKHGIDDTAQIALHSKRIKELQDTQICPSTIDGCAADRKAVGLRLSGIEARLARAENEAGSNNNKLPSVKADAVRSAQKQADDARSDVGDVKELVVALQAAHVANSASNERHHQIIEGLRNRLDEHEQTSDLFRHVVITKSKEVADLLQACPSSFPEPANNLPKKIVASARLQDAEDPSIPTDGISSSSPEPGDGSEREDDAKDDLQSLDGPEPSRQVDSARTSGHTSRQMFIPTGTMTMSDDLLKIVSRHSPRKAIARDNSKQRDDKTDPEWTPGSEAAFRRSGRSTTSKRDIEEVDHGADVVDDDGEIAVAPRKRVRSE